MDRMIDPPWALGQTFYGVGGTPVAADFMTLPGKEFVFEDTQHGTNKRVRVRVVRNQSGITLAAKRLVTFKTSAAGDMGFETEVDGYADTTAERSYPVDEQLAAGVANYDLFYIVVEGPALCSTNTAADATNVINVGDNVVAVTAAASTSTATTHANGRVRLIDLTGATQLLANQIMNTNGRALSAMTTANTVTDILISVGKW